MVSFIDRWRAAPRPIWNRTDFRHILAREPESIPHALMNRISSSTSSRTSFRPAFFEQMKAIAEQSPTLGAQIKRWLHNPGAVGTWKRACA